MIFRADWKRVEKLIEREEKYIYFTRLRGGSEQAIRTAQLKIADMRRIYYFDEVMIPALRRTGHACWYLGKCRWRVENVYYGEMWVYPRADTLLIRHSGARIHGAIDWLWRNCIKEQPEYPDYPE